MQEKELVEHGRKVAERLKEDPNDFLTNIDMIGYVTFIREDRRRRAKINGGCCGDIDAALVTQRCLGVGLCPMIERAVEIEGDVFRDD